MADKKPHESAGICDVRLLVIIADRNRSRKLTRVLRKERVRFHFISLAEGTAGSDMMNMLGLGSSEKAVFVCFKPYFAMSRLIGEVCSKLQLSTPGHGIAFTLTPNAINNALLKNLMADDNDYKEGEMEEMDCPHHKSSGYDLIIAVVNQGHADEVMSAAKSAGARGGTVLHGCRIGIEEGTTFFGIPIQHERDIVAILAPTDVKTSIMAAVTEKCGMCKTAQGMIMSLPTDEVYGITPIDDVPSEFEIENIKGVALK